MDPKVDARIAGDGKWSDELKKLQKIALSTGLTEELKWGQPCYTLDGKNVVLIHGFKDYFALLFMKGALMKDPNKLLIQQTENVQSGRQIRFTEGGEVAQLAPVLKKYVEDAIAIEKSGAKVEKKTTAEFKMPDEFKAALDKKPALKKAFEALTPGRQRGYLLHFAGAKQAKTREDRIAKAAPRIMKGKGLLDD
jgi:uncharacterized protein YdeI (YjbR/CyaY-like superfamily)